jgi:hypothetical protein
MHEGRMAKNSVIHLSVKDNWLFQSQSRRIGTVLFQLIANQANVSSSAALISFTA